MMLRINKWIIKLTTIFITEYNNVPLSKRSTYLTTYRGVTVEMPGAYLTLSSPINRIIQIYLEMPPKISSFGSKLPYVIRNNTPHRIITMISDNGTYISLINPHYINVMGHSRIEERISQMHIILNECLKKQVSTKRRTIFFHNPLIIPITHLGSLIEDSISNISLYDIYRINCYKRIKSIILEHKNDITIKQLYLNSLNNCINEQREKIYLNICSQVGDNILSDYMYIII